MPITAEAAEDGSGTEASPPIPAPTPIPKSAPGSSKNANSSFREATSLPLGDDTDRVNVSKRLFPWNVLIVNPVFDDPSPVVVADRSKTALSTMLIV